MHDLNSPLLEAFVSWTEQVKLRCRSDVGINVFIGPPDEKRGASINFEDANSASSIVVWSSGEFECEYRQIDSSLDIYNYSEDVLADQFDVLALPVLSKYLVQE